jgi:hypothetical protein
MLKKVGSWWFHGGRFIFLYFMRERKLEEKIKHVKNEFEHERR